MDAEIELLTRFSDEQQSIARHHDEERARLTQYVLVVAAAAVGVTKIGVLSLFVNVVLGVFVIVTGFVGLLLTKQYSRECEEGASCANLYRERLLAKLRALSPAVSAEDHALKYSAAWPWYVLHGLVMGLGVALLVCGYIHGLKL